MRMSVRGKRFIATAVGTALIVPAVVLASGGPSGSFDDSIGLRLKFSSSGGAVHTLSGAYTTVPGMGLPNNATESYKLPVTVQISADMTRGKARFRVIADHYSGATLVAANERLTPASALFASPGSNSFQFVEAGSNSDTSVRYRVQWKRVGSGRAKAANVVMTLFGNPD